MLRHPGFRLVGAVLAIGAVLLAGACGGDTAGPETGVDVEDITDEDADFGEGDIVLGAVGETVTISAEIADVLSPSSFTLEAPGLENELLVLSAAPAEVSEGDAVQVTGTVRRFAFAEFTEDFELGDRDLYEPFENQRFIQATNVDQRVPQE